METKKKLKPTKKPAELRHQYIFDNVTLGDGDEEQTFKILKVKSPDEWPAASEYKTSHPFSLPGSNAAINIPLQGISFGQWLDMEARLPIPPNYEETGVESEAELELKKKEVQDEQDRIENIRRVEIFEICTQKEIPGKTVEEKLEYLEGFGTAEVEALLSYILDKFSITPVDSIYLSTYNELLRKKKTFVEFTGFDDWKSLSSLGYTVRIHRPFEDHITEFNLKQISDKQKKEIESKTKTPRVPSRPRINKETGKVDPNNPIQDFDNPTWRKNVRQVQKVRTLMMFEHCLPFEIPGKNEEERYNWIGNRLLGDVLKLKHFIETEVYSYRAQFDFFTNS